MMIKLTVEAGGQELRRVYTVLDPEEKDWNESVLDMLDTIEKSTEPMKLNVKHE